MVTLKKFKSHPDIVNYFKELLFYNKHTKKPQVKHLENIDLLSVVPFKKN